MASLQRGKTESQSHHPWYKERLRTKFLKETNHKLNLSGALNCQQWKFLPKAADDLRDGYPASSDASDFHPSGIQLPILQNTGHDSKPAPKPKKHTIEQICYSKLLPQQQARREHIAEIEYGLTQHPLALYPHLEEGLSSELFEEIVEILDPEMRLKSPSDSYEALPEEQEDVIITPAREQQELQSLKSRETSTRLSTMSEQSRIKNPYTWILKQEELGKKDKRSKIQRQIKPALDENVKHVTKDFTDWVASLGGESSTISEETIFSLFASGYDTKPTLSVPIHVVELNNVPAELRMSVGVPPQQHISKTSPRIREQSKETTYSPSWVKSRYGAWYLDPKIWKKQKVNEALIDPAIEKEKGIHSKTRLSQKDEELLQLHGTTSFKDFIENNGYRKPEFLSKILCKKDASSSETENPAEPRDISSAGKPWYRTGSASTHEESIIN